MEFIPPTSQLTAGEGSIMENTSITSHCSYCSFRCPSKYQLLKHLFESHSSNKDFKISCPGNDCPKSFATFSSFLSHANRKHPMWKEQLESSTRTFLFCDGLSQGGLAATTASKEADLDSSSYENPEENPNEARNDADHQADPDSSIDAHIPVFSNLTTNGAEGSCANDSIINNGVSCLDKSVHSQAVAAKFLLTLKEQYRISQTALEFTINAVKDIVAVHSSRDHEELQHDVLLNPFEGVETEYMQTKFYREHFGLVVCIQLKQCM